MVRFLFFLLILAVVIYFATSWIIKWVASTKQYVERKEYEEWKKYDAKINPKPKPNTTKKKK